MQHAIKAIGSVSSEAGASMRAWQIIVASAVVASIAVAALFLPGAARSPDGAASLFRDILAGRCDRLACRLQCRGARVEHRGGCSRAGRRRMPAKPGWIGRAAICCGLASRNISAPSWYCSRWVLLPVAVATEPFFSMPAAIGPSPALAACAVGDPCRGTRLAYRDRCRQHSALRRLGAPSSAPGSIRNCFRKSSSCCAPARPSRSRLPPELAEQLRQRDHATLEAIKELAGAMSRVRNGISEIQHGLQQRGPEQAGAERFRGAGRCRRTVGELRAATAALTAAVAKLEDIAAGLAALSPRSACRLRPAAMCLPARARSSRPNCRNCCETWQPAPRRVRRAPADISGSPDAMLGSPI